MTETSRTRSRAPQEQGQRQPRPPPDPAPGLDPAERRLRHSFPAPCVAPHLGGARRCRPRPLSLQLHHRRHWQLPLLLTLLLLQTPLPAAPDLQPRTALAAPRPSPVPAAPLHPYPYRRSPPRTRHPSAAATWRRRDPALQRCLPLAHFLSPQAACLPPQRRAQQPAAPAWRLPRALLLLMLTTQGLSQQVTDQQLLLRPLGAAALPAGLESSAARHCPWPAVIAPLRPHPCPPPLHQAEVRARAEQQAQVQARGQVPGRS